MKIYTRAGDTGSTSLYDGSRVTKSSAVIEALGALDELNCDLGCAIAFAADAADPWVAVLNDIQAYLLDLGSLLAYPRAAERRGLSIDSSGARVLRLEAMIDSMTAALPPLANFILPGGTQATAHIHKARAAARRAERRVVATVDLAAAAPAAAGNAEGVQCCIKFLNRFSDYLFTLARFVDHGAGVRDAVYQQPRGAKAPN